MIPVVLPLCGYVEVSVESSRGRLWRVQPAEVVAAKASFKSEGWKIYELDGLEIRDKQSFFEAVRSVVPLDPPLASNRSWDALSDSLSSGLMETPEQQVAIIWSESARMAARDPQQYDIAIQVLEDIVALCGDDEVTDNNPKRVVVVVQRLEEELKH